MIGCSSYNEKKVAVFNTKENKTHQKRKKTEDLAQALHNLEKEKEKKLNVGCTQGKRFFNFPINQVL